MSSYYIFDADENTKNKNGNPATQNLNMGKFAITNLKTYPQNNTDATSKKYVDDETKKLLDLAATRPMQDDLDLGNNSIIGIKDILASNSVVSKNFVESNFVKRRQETIMEASINMANFSIKNLPDPRFAQYPATKNYVDTQIANVNIPLVYNHTLGFTALSHNTWEYASAPVNTTPFPWLNCDGLDKNSYFELGVHTFDTDNSIPSTTMTMEYRLQAFEANGTLRSWTFFNGNLKGYQIPSENIFCINQKYFFKNFPSGNYKQFKVCRLSVNRKFSGTFGNESCITFAIVK